MHVKQPGIVKQFEAIGRGCLFAVHKRGVHLFLKVWRQIDQHSVVEAGVHLGPDLSLMTGLPTIYSQEALAGRTCMELSDSRLVVSRDLRYTTFGRAIAPGAVLLSSLDPLITFLHRESRELQYAQITSGRITTQVPADVVCVNNWSIIADDTSVIAEFAAEPMLWASNREVVLDDGTPPS